MVAQYYGLIKSILYFRKLYDAGRDGLSISGLVKVFEKLNFSVTVYRLSKLNLSDTNIFPAILHMKKDHFIVLEKYSKNTGMCTIIDPDAGKKKVDLNKLMLDVNDLAIFPLPNNKFITEKEKISVWQPLAFLKPFVTGKLIISLILSIFTYLFTFIIPILIQKFIDRLSFGKNNIFTINDMSMVILSISLFLFVSLIRNKVIVNLEVIIDKKLLFKMMDQITKLPYHFFEVRRSGDILFRINILNNIRLLISEGLVRGLIDLGSVFFILIYMTIIAPKLIVMVLVIIIGISFIASVINNYIVAINKDELIELGNITGMETEVVEMMFDIKCLGIENIFVERLETQYENFKKIFKKREFISRTNVTILQFFQLFVPFTLLLINISFLNETKLTIGMVVAYYTLCNMVISNSVSLFQEISNLRLMKNYLLRINDILCEDIESNQGSNPVYDITSVKLNNIHFSYSDNSGEVLKGVTIQGNKGEKIAIVGSSGSGKSTLIKILMGLYQPSEGEVLINGVTIKEFDKESIKKLMGIIPQEARLFRGTVKYNITLGNENILDKQVMEALKKANIFDEIQKMPMKENTLLSEGGNNLSGGQRQRLALARTIVAAPKLLILDEATSSLDGINEKEVTKMLSENSSIQIIISHKFSTIAQADYIYVLDEGSIVEEGNIDDLVKKNGLFVKLFAKQIESITLNRECEGKNDKDSFCNRNSKKSRFCY